MRTIIILVGAQAEILREIEQSGMLTTEQSCIQLYYHCSFLSVYSGHIAIDMFKFVFVALAI